MTISASNRYHRYSPVVLTAAFDVPFPIFSASDLRVVVDGVDTGAYSVTATFVDGRSVNAVVTLAVAATGVDVEIFGNRVPRRENQYLDSSPNLAKNLQYDADVLTAEQQEIARDFGRSLKLPLSLGNQEEIKGLTDGATIVFDATLGRMRPGPTETHIADAQQSADAAADAAADAVAAATLAVSAKQNLYDANRGAWATATAYARGELALESGTTYLCLVNHTSGVFATDVGAGRWQVFAQKGNTGTGSGDVLAANNGSDFASAGLVRANLSLFAALLAAETGADALARVAANPRGMFFVAGTGMTNIPTGGAANDVFWGKGIDGNNVTAFWVRADGTIFTNARIAGTWGGWVAQATQGYADLEGQTYANVTSSRTHSISYQNTTDRPIRVYIVAISAAATYREIQVSADNVNWFYVGHCQVNSGASIQSSFIVPPNWRYRINGSAEITSWVEFR